MSNSLTIKDAHGRGPIAWIVEATLKSRTTSTTLPAPYLTLKQEVAEKRERAGDIVTPYYSQNEPEDDEL